MHSKYIRGGRKGSQTGAPDLRDEQPHSKTLSKRLAQMPLAHFMSTIVQSFQLVREQREVRREAGGHRRVNHAVLQSRVDLVAAAQQLAACRRTCVATYTAVRPHRSLN